MGLLSVLSLSHRWASERIAPGDTVIDATAGNGVDTLFLAKAVGPKGTVYAFDIQELALINTRQRLEAAHIRGELEKSLPKLHLLLESHDRMKEAIPPHRHGLVSAVLFNLGFLPGPEADASLITKPETTLAALEAALFLLRPGGLLSIVVYPGHEGGEAEAAAVEAWSTALPQTAAHAAVYRMLQKPHAPYLIAVEKRVQ
ncbi:class I SAM-dependent methyltransferase [Paenibacillus tarimensis]